MKVAIICNLRPQPGASSPAGDAFDDTFIEWDDPATIDAIQEALARDHAVTVHEQGAELESRLTAARPDIVFNVAEGLEGPDRESEVPALLDRLGIPFTGSSAATLRTCLDKAATKRALLRAGIPTPGYTVIHDPAATGGLDGFPLIVKPLHEGSSKGIVNDSVVRTPAALHAQVERVLRTYRQPALVESFLTGREFTVALLGNPPDVRALPPVEVLFSELPEGAMPIYSYEAKWIWDTTEHPLPLFACPADVPASLREAVVDVCRRAFIALECRDWCRIDVRLDDKERPNVLELNPLPGVIPSADSTSCFTKAAAAAGMSHAELVRLVLSIACRRNGLAA